MMEEEMKRKLIRHVSDFFCCKYPPWVFYRLKESLYLSARLKLFINTIETNKHEELIAHHVFNGLVFKYE